MLRVIASISPLLRDALITVLSLEKKEDTTYGTIYQHGGWILLHLRQDISLDIANWMAETYNPDRLYLPYLGYSIDVVREVGDVIVPNTFLPYNANIESLEIDKQNRDTLVENPRFLEVFDEQKDYYVEDYGLSIGGIIVDSAPKHPSDELIEKLMLVYEADVYTESIVFPAIDVVEADILSTMILVGIYQGKQNPHHIGEDEVLLTVQNIVTTIKLLEDEEK